MSATDQHPTPTEPATFADLVRAEFKRASEAGETWIRELDPALVPLIRPDVER